MPNWFKRQLRQAFYHKDLPQIRTLNDCWYYYRQIEERKQEQRNIYIENSN